MTAAAEKTSEDLKARLEATGLNGHIVVGPRAERFLVTQLGSLSSDRVRGPIIKRDGTLSQRMRECEIAQAVSLGLFRS